MKTMHQKMKQRLTARYDLNKKKVVGDSCKCPSCGAEFVKTHYQQKFCKSKQGTVCKDYYWNFVTESKRNNTTRISPANAAYRTRIIVENSKFGVHDVYDDFHPFEGLNDEEYKNH